MGARKVTYYAIDTEDRPGEGAKFAITLRDSKVNLKGLWGFGVGQGKAKIFCVPQNAKKFTGAAKKAGWQVAEGTAFFVSGTDKVGALVGPLTDLGHAGINIHAVDVIALSGKYGAYIWVDEKDVASAAAVLKAK